MPLHDTLNLAIAHHAAGRLAEAERIYREVLAHHPDQPIALCNLGRIAAATGHLDHAATLLTRAASLDPTNADCLGVLGEVFEHLNRLDDAIAAYQRARALKPDWVEVLNNLGHALLLRHRPADAADALEHSLRVQPHAAIVHSNLAEAYRAQLHFREAEASARTAITLDPHLPAAHGNLGNALHALGKFDDAVACHREALRLNESFIDAWNNLALSLTMLRRYDEAIDAYHRALAIRPNPSAAEITVNLATVFMATDRLDDAIDAYRAALKLRPDLPHAHSNLGNALRERGLIDDSLAEFRAALALRPDFAMAHSNLLFAMNFHPDITNEQLLAEHRVWAAKHADRLSPSPGTPGEGWGEGSREARLRVGFISPDFRDHPLGRFMLPLLQNLDRERLQVICYSAAKRPDAITASLRVACREWRDIVAVTEPQLAELIRADRIDVLVDLSLHSAGNALLAFARRPAPVQLTYLGYAGTTGMAAMDFRLTDPHLDPPGADANYSERSLRLPRTYWCYAAPPEAPADVAPPPSQSSGVVTFGCLNQFSKVSSAARQTWAGILAVVPNSRLLLHTLPGRHRDQIAAEFAAAGIDASRIEWVGKLPIAEYLATYDRIDIALDPFPYNGGTTTCDALWMGVPVVALAGNRAVARAGVSILTNVGLPELVAQDTDDYISIATALTTDATRLADLRRTMRDRMRSSPLMDAAAFAQDFEEVIYRAWSERQRTACRS